MANERLRRAIQHAGLRLEDVAEHVEIDVKTAERWITKGRVPHARNRARTAQLLSVDELDLWPQVSEGRNGRSASDGELLRIFAHRGAVPAERWYELLEATTERLDLLAHAGLSCPTAARTSRGSCARRPRPASKCGFSTATQRAMRSRSEARRRTSGTDWLLGFAWC